MVPQPGLGCQRAICGAVAEAAEVDTALSPALAWLPAHPPACHPHGGKAMNKGLPVFFSSPFSKNKLESSPQLPPIFSCLTLTTLCSQMSPHVCPLLDRWVDPEVQMVGAGSPLWPLPWYSWPLQLCPAWEKSTEPAPGP
jgi:hypothetical protein